MKTGQKVKSNSVAKSPHSGGTILRVYDDNQLASVMWVLTEGGLLCQAERIKDLEKVVDKAVK